MLTNRYFRVAVAMVGVLACSGLAAGQLPTLGNPAPVSNLGGYTSTALRGIYQEDVGQGFSGSSLNQIALQNARAQVPYFGQQTRPVGGGRSSGLGLGASGGSKPFSTYSPQPTTSPYLNLFREDFDGNSDLNYNTLVRPQLQQQQFNNAVQRQGIEMSRRMQSMAAQADFNPQGAKDQYPTGHSTAYRYYGHYHQRVPYRPGKQAP